MYYNTCSKCGQEFETKNPKRVVCPTCLYPDRPPGSPPPSEMGGGGYGPPRQAGYGDYPQQQAPGGYAPPRGGGYGPPRQGGYGAPPQGGGYGPPRQGGYGPPPQGGGYGPPRQGGYGAPPQGGGYGPPRQGGYGPPRQGGYGPPRGGGYGPPRQGGYGPPRGGGGFGGGRRPMGPPRRKKNLLVSKEHLEKIELMYKAALPLPNPDLHEVIAKELELEPSKVFFGINLVRAKMKLPKLDYPKRKLAVTPDQITAIELLYEPYLPTPPIGVHKLLAKQLKMDEWRVHVAIGLIRKNKNMPRWDEERADLTDAMKEQIKVRNAQKAIEQEEAKKAKAEAAAQRKLEREQAEKEKAEAEHEAEKDVQAANPQQAE